MDACGLQPDLQAYNTLLAALTKVGHMQQALQVCCVVAVVGAVVVAASSFNHNKHYNDLLTVL